MAEAWSFAHTERPRRLLMGTDAASRIPDEMVSLGVSRALLVTTPGRHELREAARAALGDACVGVFDEAKEQVPRGTVTAAQAALARSKADCVVVLGGGSAIGVGKALALESGTALPLIAIPTTYAGSEATNIWGITDGGEKTTGRDDRVAPVVIAYVPEWTTTLPASISAPSGLNAIAHCVEALYAENATPATDMMAVEGTRAIATALPRIRENPEDLDARSRALWGAYLAGRALDAASMGLHHKICHVLGGSFGTPHARTHATVLPYTMAYNATHAPEAMRQVATALGVDDAVLGMWELGRTLGIPSALSELGFEESDVPRAVAIALKRTYPNPRPIEAEPLAAMLRAAARGDRPSSY